MKQSKHKKRLPLCVQCNNTSCQDRCNPSSCEHFTTSFNEKKINNLKIESIIDNRGIELTQTKPTFLEVTTILKRSLNHE